MAYFSKFPLVSYPIKDGSVFRLVLARNLLRRIALSDDIKGSDSAFVEYNIKDGERPEHIAEKIYGDPSFHWIVLLTNDVIDPYHGWYKSSAAMEDFIQKKHGGNSVFFTNISDDFSYISTIEAGSTLTQGSVSSKIKEYQPTLCKLMVSGSGYVSGAAIVTVADGTVYNIKLHRVDQSYLSVHHFGAIRPTTDSSANETVTIDPLSQYTTSYSVVSGIIGSSENPYPLTTQGVGYTGSDIVSFWETHIGRYMGVSGDRINTYAVSNQVHEINENEKRRTIKILHPRFKRQAVQELESLLRV
jgi:hypothetical protein